MRNFARLLGSAAMLLAVSATSGAVAQEGTLKIGAIVSTTGGLATVGQAKRDGMLLAQKAINARGGVKGKKIELVIEDDGTNPDVALNKANALLFTQGTRAMIGPSGLGATLAVGAVSQRAEIPIIALAGLGAEVEKQRTCVFHMSPAQELNARVLLAYARHLKAKRVAVLHDSGFGRAVFSSMRAMGPEFGVDFVAVEQFEIAATDTTAQAAKVKAANPDVVLVITVSAAPFRNLAQIKIGVPVVSAHSTANYETIKAMGSAAEGVVHSEFIIAENPLPHQAAFVEAYRKEYGHLPKHFAAMGWDTVHMIAKAYEETSLDATGKQLCDALRKPFDGATARYDFSAPDMGGLTPASFVYSVIENGQFKRLDFKAPAQ